MEPTQFDFIFGFYAKLLSKFLEVVFTSLPLWSAIVFDLWRFLLPEFRNARVRSKIRTFQVVPHKLKF
jgi:hypothetical protein